jgi:hypothetical protein
VSELGYLFRAAKNSLRGTLMNVVESNFSSHLHFISSPFSAWHGEWRVLVRASTEDEFAIPDGWEPIEIPEEDPSPHIVNQVPNYHL